MDMNWITIREIWESMYKEYHQINENIIMPKGFDAEFNMNMVRVNTKAREQLNKFSDTIKRMELGDIDKFDDLPLHLKELHECFAEWYAMIVEGQKMQKENEKDNKYKAPLEKVVEVKTEEEVPDEEEKEEVKEEKKFRW